MTSDLLGQEIAPIVRQRDLLAGPCGLGVEAIWKVIDGVAYVRTESGFIVRADGTGPLIPEKAPEGREPPLLGPEKPRRIRK